jgi:hypothetical protein
VAYFLVLSSQTRFLTLFSASCTQLAKDDPTFEDATNLDTSKKVTHKYIPPNWALGLTANVATKKKPEEGEEEEKPGSPLEMF